MASKENTSDNSSKIKCDLCSITFTTEQDKEQHMKLEHKEHQRPTGVT
jgi:hypothetical protein